jgi:hypothetical protein
MLHLQATTLTALDGPAKQQLSILEGQLAWMVSIVGSVIRGRCVACWAKQVPAKASLMCVLFCQALVSPVDQDVMQLMAAAAAAACAGLAAAVVRRAKRALTVQPHAFDY